MTSFRADEPAWRGVIRGLPTVARYGGDGSPAMQSFPNPVAARAIPLSRRSVTPSGPFRLTGGPAVPKPGHPHAIFKTPPRLRCSPRPWPRARRSGRKTGRPGDRAPRTGALDQRPHHEDLPWNTPFRPQGPERSPVDRKPALQAATYRSERRARHQVLIKRREPKSLVIAACALAYAGAIGFSVADLMRDPPMKAYSIAPGGDSTRCVEIRATSQRMATQAASLYPPRAGDGRDCMALPAVTAMDPGLVLARIVNAFLFVSAILAALWIVVAMVRAWRRDAALEAEGVQP
jgi:hypothetical protein